MKHKSFGEVSNLEEYVKADWWKTIFNSNYLKTDADVVEDNEITRSEIDLFSDILKLNKEDKILDLSCGQGRHSLELARRGFFNIDGLDRSHFLIQRAKNISKKENLNVRFREGDARKLPFTENSFNYVMILGNSFGYFETISDDLKVLREVYDALDVDGKLLIDITDGEYIKNQFQQRSWEWISKKEFVCRERSLSIDKQRLISREIIIDIEDGVTTDQFYAERLYTKDSLVELLTKSGFKNIQFHDTINTDSKRNQDLGMMEKRHIITAEVNKEIIVKKSAKTKIYKKTVAVILGDPKKKDIIKPAGVFDDDDLHTIKQLKDALKQIKDYNFIYFCNHDTLLKDLQKSQNKIDFVFNLCDEGYNNEARKELHIPSMLELLEIPYSGANPQCLAFCYDKSLVRGIAKEMDIAVPEAFFIKPKDNIYEMYLNFPLIVKPNFGDSSFGITKDSVVHNIDGLTKAISNIRDKFGYDKPILVEEFLTGKDITVGMIGNLNDNYIILPIIEEDYSELPKDLPKICGYEAKWEIDSPYNRLKSIQANLPEDVEKNLIADCIKLIDRLECRDYSRIDWRLDSEGKPKLLEVNPNPGWCWDGHLAKMSKFTGIEYQEMLYKILRTTEDRILLKKKV